MLFLILTIGSIGSDFLIKQELKPSLMGLTSYEPYLFQKLLLTLNGSFEKNISNKYYFSSNLKFT